MPKIFHPRRQALIEIILIFAVFAIQGGWPIPDNNEAYYLGKAMHYWNPDWLSGDFFLETADAHTVFYFTFGWLSLWLSPVVLACTGRAICWSLLAWGWRRLSFAAVPRPWWSILTAALFVGLLERFHLAGEWVVGGVEAKPFAYALVFFGLSSILQNRWNRGLLFFGAAGAFHPLVGGWSAVAAGFAWIWMTYQARTTADATNGRGFVMPTLRSLWPGILGGIVLALPGVIPSLMLDLGSDAETARQAHLLYVFERLPHHLALSGMHREFILRIALLACFWILLGIWRRRVSPFSGRRHVGPDVTNQADVPSAAKRQYNTAEDFHGPLNILCGFIGGAIAIAFVGAAIHLLIPFDEGLAAGLLRFYWFRLLDVALPLGVAIEAVAIINGMFLSCRRRLPSPNAAIQHQAIGDGSRFLQAEKNGGEHHTFFPHCWLALAIVLAAFHVGDRAIDRVAPAPPRTHKLAGNKDGSTRKADFDDWLAACRWVKNSGEIPPDAMFISPRLSRTFRWYADRREVVVWKDVPQSAAGIVEWWRRVQDIHGTGLPEGYPSWHEPLAEAGVDHLRQMAEKYKADYAITDRTEPPLDLPVLYQNHTYIVYKLK